MLRLVVVRCRLVVIRSCVIILGDVRGGTVALLNLVQLVVVGWVRLVVVVGGVVRCACVHYKEDMLLLLKGIIHD